MRLVLAALAATAMLSCALARDNGQYSQVDPATRNWFHGLKNSTGLLCCEGADGIRLTDLDWDYDGHGYRVRLDGKTWEEVPNEAVLKMKNRAGYAIVWKYNGNITCFLPGALT
jgi:hypothetical protein